MGQYFPSKWTSKSPPKGKGKKKATAADDSGSEFEGEDGADEGLNPVFEGAGLTLETLLVRVKEIVKVMDTVDTVRSTLRSSTDPVRRMLSTTTVEWNLQSKSQLRDWGLMAEGFILEWQLVKQYRQRLLDGPFGHLRNAIIAVLSPYCKRANHFNPSTGADEAVRKYIFLDHLNVPLTLSPLKEKKVEDFVKSHSMFLRVKHTRKELRSFVNLVKRMQCFKAADKGKMDEECRRAVEVLVRVSTLFIFVFSHSLY